MNTRLHILDVYVTIFTCANKKQLLVKGTMYCISYSSGDFSYFPSFENHHLVVFFFAVEYVILTKEWIYYS